MTRQHVNQKVLAAAALVIAAAVAFAPVNRSHTKAETVSSADSSRSLAAR